jgi:hypothetical protein
MTKGFKPIFTITNRITAGLTRIERTRGFLKGLIFVTGLQQCLRHLCDMLCDTHGRIGGWGNIT